MAKFYDKLVNYNTGYMGYEGTVIVSNLTEHCNLCVITDKEKYIIFGSEEGNYSGGISIFPEMNKFYPENFNIWSSPAKRNIATDFSFYYNEVYRTLKWNKENQRQFYENIKKEAYPYHKDMFNKIEKQPLPRRIKT